MWSLITGFFSYGGLHKTANDAIRKLGGLDELTGKDKVDAYLDVVNATKHQSPARRFIAMAVTGAWAVFLTCWLTLTLFGFTEMALTVQVFMKDMVKEPFNYIIGFYFVTHILSGIKK